MFDARILSREMTHLQKLCEKKICPDGLFNLYFSPRDQTWTLRWVDREGNEPSTKAWGTQGKWETVGDSVTAAVVKFAELSIDENGVIGSVVATRLRRALELPTGGTSP